MSSRLQTHSASTWLTESIPFEDYEAVRVGHQQVKTKVEARPPPAVLTKGKCNTLFHWEISHVNSTEATVAARQTHISIFSEFPATPHTA